MSRPAARRASSRSATPLRYIEKSLSHIRPWSDAQRRVSAHMNPAAEAGPGIARDHELDGGVTDGADAVEQDRRHGPHRLRGLYALESVAEFVLLGLEVAECRLRRGNLERQPLGDRET